LAHLNAQIAAQETPKAFVMAQLELFFIAVHTCGLKLKSLCACIAKRLSAGFEMLAKRVQQRKIFLVSSFSRGNGFVN
jgi:hypothetical protein